MKPATSTLPISPAMAHKLLERIVYEGVIECIDFDSLARMEDMLAMELCGTSEDDVDKAVAIAKAMIDQAWSEAISDARRYVNIQGHGDGMDCELCDAEAAAHARKQPRAS
jgi:hypothetical protein